MKYRFLWIEGQDFMPFRSVRLDFDKFPGIVQITGDRGADRSNGSGKSAFLEMLVYAWHGRTVRKLAAGKEIRRGAKSTVIRSALRFEDGRELVVERSRGPGGPSCRLTGVDSRALAGGVQAAIDAMIGDYDLFTTTTMFTGESASFCRKTDAGRKQLLEHMLGISGYEEAAERAKSQSQALSTMLSDRNAASIRAVETRDRLQSSRAEVALQGLRLKSEVMRQYHTAVREAAEASRLAMDASRVVADWLKDAADREDKARVARTAAEERQDQAQALVDALTTEKAIQEAEITGLQMQEREIRKQIEQLQSGKHPDVCDTCGQVWPQEGDPDAVAAAVKKHTAYLHDVRQRAAPGKARVFEIAAQLEDAHSARGQAMASAREASARIDHSRIRTLLAEAAEAAAELSVKQSAVSRIASSIPEDVTLDPELDRLDREVVLASQAVLKAKDDIASTSAALTSADFWKKGFGKSGLPSYLVDSAIPGMNAVVAEVAAALTDGELSIRFDAAGTKGTQSVLSVEVEYAEGGEGFDSASRGERTRVDVAVLFALRDVAARSGVAECAQLFLDEVMDGADAHFSQAFIRMLRRRYKGHQVLLISHDPSVASLVDGALKVVKRSGLATLQ